MAFNFDPDLSLGHKILIGLTVFVISATFVGLTIATVILTALVVVQLIPGLVNK